MPSDTDSKLTVPNVLTGLRIVLAAVAAVCFAYAVAQRTAVVLCVVATLLDAFDGWYARTFAQRSSLGEHLDPFADKLLMAVVYTVLAVHMDSTTVWTLLVLIGLREVGMTAFRSYSFHRYRKFIPANRLGKAKMVVQSTVGLAFVAYGYFRSGGFDIPVAAVAAPLSGILVLSYLSAAVYVRAHVRAWYSVGVAAEGLDAVRMRSNVGERGSERLVVGK